MTPLRVDFHLLDRQIADVAGRKVEPETGDDGQLRATALPTGQVALGRRIGGGAQGQEQQPVTLRYRRHDLLNRGEIPINGVQVPFEKADVKNFPRGPGSLKLQVSS